MEDIKVHVTKYPDRNNYVMRYADPITGKRVARSTGTTKHRDAIKAAAKWEAELREGRYAAPSRMTWEGFRDKYENEIVSGMAESSQEKVGYVLDVLERTINPQRLRDITAARLSYFTAEIRKGQKLKGRKQKPVSPATVDAYLRTVRAMLNQAVAWKFLAEAPEIRFETRPEDGKAKGRALVGEEFDRLLVAIEKIVGADEVAEWSRYLHGLWLSGLRLGESLRLYWDRRDSPTADYLEVDLTGRRPMMVIPAKSQKSKKDTLLPITPDFAAFLAQTPVDERRGPVFNPGAHRRHEGHERRVERVSNTIAAAGRKAGIVVNDCGKCASAHDLRRSFGMRWAAKVMPHVLMQLMRHRQISTTMAYYAGRDAEAVADLLWSEKGNIPGNTAQNEASKETPEVGASRSQE